MGKGLNDTNILAIGAANPQASTRDMPADRLVDDEAAATDSTAPPRSPKAFCWTRTLPAPVCFEVSWRRPWTPTALLGMAREDDKGEGNALADAVSRMAKIGRLIHGLILGLNFGARFRVLARSKNNLANGAMVIDNGKQRLAYRVDLDRCPVPMPRRKFHAMTIALIAAPLLLLLPAAGTCMRTSYVGLRVAT